MSMKVRALWVAAVLVVAMGNLGCGHYICHTTLGASTCTATPPGKSGGTGGTGGGGTTPTAFAFAGVLSSTGIQSFTFSATAKSFLATPNVTTATAPASGGGALIVVQGKYLYGNLVTQPNQIFSWTIDSTGGLTSIPGSPLTLATWTGTTIGTFATNPSGSLLFMTDPGAVQGQSTVHVFQVGGGGGLTEASGSPLALPFSARSMGMDGLGKYLYVVSFATTSPSNAEIGAFSVSGTGVLTPVVGSPFAFPMGQVAGDASGLYLVGTTMGSSGEDAHLYVFSIQQSGATAGALTAVSGSPFATSFSSAGIAVQPRGGEFVYSFNGTPTTPIPLEGFQLDTTTGALTKVTGSPFTSFAGEQGQFDQSGAFLFGQFGNILTAYQVPSNGALASVANIGEGWITDIAIADAP